MGEGIFPVIHSRNALLLLTKAQPFQRPRQQPQQLQQSSRCYRQQLSQQSNQPSAAARTHVLLQEFRFYGDWFRHGLVHSWSHWPGRSLCHRLCGYPAWSRECKSTSGSSGAEAGSRTVTGDGSSVGGSGEGLPLVRGKPSLPTGGPTPARLRTRVGPSMVVLPSWPHRAGGSDRGWFRCRPVLGHIVPVPVAYTAISCGSRERKSSSGSSVERRLALAQ